MNEWFHIITIAFLLLTHTHTGANFYATTTATRKFFAHLFHYYASIFISCITKKIMLTKLFLFIRRQSFHGKPPLSEANYICKVVIKKTQQKSHSSICSTLNILLPFKLIEKWTALLRLAHIRILYTFSEYENFLFIYRRH